MALTRKQKTVLGGAIGFAGVAAVAYALDGFVIGPSPNNPYLVRQLA